MFVSYFIFRELANFLLPVMRKAMTMMGKRAMNQETMENPRSHKKDKNKAQIKPMMTAMSKFKMLLARPVMTWKAKVAPNKITYTLAGEQRVW